MQNILCAEEVRHLSEIIYKIITTSKKNLVSQAVIKWYNENGRQFYWRLNDMSDWSWIVLEMLLRKTQAATVNKMFPSFIAKYSEPSMLKAAKPTEVESDLFVLGLYKQRCEALRGVASIICNEHKGELPKDDNILMQWPHVGPYIANAIKCFCFKEPAAIVDMNVARVLTRVGGIKTPSNARCRWIWDYAQTMLPDKCWVEYNYGLLDIGALYCRGKNPKCGHCTLSRLCDYFSIKSDANQAEDSEVVKC